MIGIGFGEITLLALFVALVCFAPSISIVCHRYGRLLVGYGRLFVGSLSLIVMAVSLLIEATLRLIRYARSSVA